MGLNKLLSKVLFDHAFHYYRVLRNDNCYSNLTKIEDFRYFIRHHAYYINVLDLRHPSRRPKFLVLQLQYSLQIGLGLFNNSSKLLIVRVKFSSYNYVAQQFNHSV